MSFHKEELIALCSQSSKSAATPGLSNVEQARFYHPGVAKPEGNTGKNNIY